MIYDQLYADILQHCQPMRPPRPWGNFVKDVDAWAPPQDGKSTIAALREKYSTKDLIRSGVASPDENKGLSLGRIFCGPSDIRILALRAIPQCNPFDLLSDEGTASGQLPVYAAVHDHLVEKGINKRGFLCVTFSMQDLISLRAVGMPAALASGLEQITRKSLAEFRSIFEPAGQSHLPHANHAPAAQPPSPAALAQQEGSDETQASGSSDPSKAMTQWQHAPIDQLQLILVGWMPSQLSRHRPGDLDRVIRSIENTGNCLGVDLNETFLWRPTAAEIRRINLCLIKGNRKDVAKAILDSLDQSAKPLTPSRSDKGSSGDFLESRARFREALLRPGSSQDYLQRRLREYQEAVDSTFVKPVFDRAIGESDPDERCRLGGLAAVNRLLHPSVELYSAKLEREITRSGLRGNGEALKIGELMKMFDVLYRLTKEDK